MKALPQKLLTATALALLTLAPLAWMQDAGTDSLSRYVPTGAVVAIEANDLGALLDTWNASPEKSAWLASDNYAEFSRSKLFLRLQEARSEFAAAAGLPLNLTQLEAIAGGESVVALYDIGELRLLYITELNRSAALETALLHSRLDLEPRRSAGIEYWVHIDSESGREVAFAVTENRLFITTDDALLGRALELHANQGEGALTDEAWYPTHGPRGDLRLIENLHTLLRSPHFRSYWIQGNITELSTYESAVADLFLEDDGIREQRRLVRTELAESIEESSVGSLANLAPTGAPFHQSWDRPTPDAIVTLLAQKLLAPSSGGQHTRYQTAPRAFGGTARIGANLEARIDTPPATVSRSSLNRQPLQALLSSTKILGLLQVQTSTIDAGLARYPSLIGILAESPWDEIAALGALQTSVQSLWTTASLDTEWQARGDYYALVGLRSLFAAVDGNLLLVSDSEELLIATLARRDNQDQDDDRAIYRARFRHNVEAATYSTAMAHLDFLEGRNPLQMPRQPSLFSDNIGSLSRVFGRVVTVEIERYDHGAYVEETVRYQMP